MELFVSASDGPPVLFLHGALVDRTLWDPVIALLPDRRCLAPTLPLARTACRCPIDRR
jgi:pimeloyl-ACP methyl ester carboxylesterase